MPDAGLAASWRTRDMIGLFGDITHLPFPAKSFDLMLAIEALEHVDRPATALAELARVGRRSFVLSVPREPVWRLANMARGKHLGALGNTPGHVQHWSRSGFTTWHAHTWTSSRSAPFPWTMVAARSCR